MTTYGDNIPFRLIYSLKMGDDDFSLPKPNQLILANLKAALLNKFNTENFLNLIKLAYPKAFLDLLSSSVNPGE